MGPSVDCIAPTGIVETFFPLAEWFFAPDPDTQAGQALTEIRFYTSADVLAFGFDPDVAAPLFEESTSDPAATSLETATALSAGAYWAYFRVTDADGVVSGWCATSFTVDVTLDPSARPTGSASGQLGCGTYTVRIQDRGGSPVRAEVKFQNVSFGRRVDDMTDARVIVAAAGLASEECCLALSNLQAWKHEVSIWRGEEEAWVGPVGDPQYDAEGVTVPARDLFQWMERRNLEHDRDFPSYVDLGVIFRQYVLDALERDKSPNITVELYKAGKSGGRSVKAVERRRAADELRELSRNGVDFTMIGRRLLVAGEELPVRELPLLTDDIVDKARLTVRGLDSASEVIVVGSTDQNSDVPHSGKAGGVGGDIGLVQMTVNETSIKDDLSAKQAAQTRVDLLSGTSEFLTVDLRPEAPLSFSDLIPGARWPVAVHVACRDVVGTFRLSEVKVDVQEDDDGQTETVTVTLEPLGTTDDGVRP